MSGANENSAVPASVFTPLFDERVLAPQERAALSWAGRLPGMVAGAAVLGIAVAVAGLLRPSTAQASTAAFASVGVVSLIVLAGLSRATRAWKRRHTNWAAIGQHLGLVGPLEARKQVAVLQRLHRRYGGVSAYALQRLAAHSTSRTAVASTIGSGVPGLRVTLALTASAALARNLANPGVVCMGLASALVSQGGVVAPSVVAGILHAAALMLVLVAIIDTVFFVAAAASKEMRQSVHACEALLQPEQSGSWEREGEGEGRMRQYEASIRAGRAACRLVTGR